MRHPTKITGVLVCLSLFFQVGATHADDSKSAPANYPTQVLFAPSGGIQNKLADLILNAQSSIIIATYNIALLDISNSLAGAQTRGVKIRIILDDDARTERMTDAGLYEHNKIPLMLWTQNSMRHSFAIFDNSVLAAGTYAWTNEGEYTNMGSMLFTGDPDAIKAYSDEFNRMWSD